jgi:hypothetical protein
VNIRQVLLKNIDVLYCDKLLKVNVPSQKFICVIDFINDIDEDAPGNKVQLLDTHLEVFLIKKQRGVLWEKIQLEGTKQELVQRRQGVLEEYNLRQAAKAKLSKDAILRQDKAAVDEGMKVDAYKRRTLEEKKKDERNEEENQMYRELDALKEKDKEIKSTVQQPVEQPLYAKEKIVLPSREPTKPKNKNIFADDDYEEEVKEAPKFVAPPPKSDSCTVEEITDEQAVEITEQETRAPVPMPEVR